MQASYERFTRACSIIHRLFRLASRKVKEPTALSHRASMRILIIDDRPGVRKSQAGMIAALAPTHGA